MKGRKLTSSRANSSLIFVRDRSESTSGGGPEEIRGGHENFEGIKGGLRNFFACKRGGHENIYTFLGGP